MNLNKFIFSKEEDIKKQIFDFYDYKIIEKNSNLELFEIKSKYQDSQDESIYEEKLFFVNYIDFKKSFKYISENYVIDKIALLWFANVLEWFDMKDWDVIIPNTFINSKDDETIFLEYSIWQNYDFNKFWLILNGICTSWDSSCERWVCADIIDDDSFFVLKEISMSWILDKTVVIKWIVWDDKDRNEASTNIVNILGIIV